MVTEPTTVDVRVRYSCQAYTASAKGLRASSTSAPEWAVKALAHKVFPDRAARVEFVSRDGQVEAWRIEA